MITLIGDVHGKYEHYHRIIHDKNRCPYSVQLGDFGFDYTTLKNVDPKHHVFIGGNHDNYDKVESVPNYLGDYGHMINFNGIDFFYYRGAYSIDRQYRTIGIDWWENEQVNIDNFTKARELYRNIQPDIMITHDCPDFLAAIYLGPNGKIYENITGWALGELWRIHQPKVWIHGHWHFSKTTQYDNTKFISLAELETYTLTKDCY